MIPKAVAEFMQRPSIKELNRKINFGKDIVAQGNILLINPDSIAADAEELGYQTSNLKNVLLKLLEEVQSKHYVGAHPPRKSYEPLIKGSDLFEFRWESKRFGCAIYIKYTLKNEIFYLVSLHKHRPR
ncbi:MAG: hypothetical protein HKO91_12615 [Desulfobacterales bacterium]|nr:hypothetical protein [Desulfobacterales bacterium]